MKHSQETKDKISATAKRNAEANKIPKQDLTLHDEIPRNTSVVLRIHDHDLNQTILEVHTFQRLILNKYEEQEPEYDKDDPTIRIKRYARFAKHSFIRKVEVLEKGDLDNGICSVVKVHIDNLTTKKSWIHSIEQIMADSTLNNRFIDEIGQEVLSVEPHFTDILYYRQ